MRSNIRDRKLLQHITYFQRDTTLFFLPCLLVHVNKFDLFFKTEWMTRTPFIPSQATLRANTTVAFKMACKLSNN